MGVAGVRIKLTIELPIEIAMVSSILSLAAIQTLVTCSAALACQSEDELRIRNKYNETARSNLRTTSGSRINPMKAFGIWYFSAVSSIEATTKR